MLAYCEAEFKLSKPVKGTTTIKREHYISAAIPREEWGLPDMPETLYYLWDWFLKLNATRQYGMSANTISYQEIQAFCNLYQIEMATWEVDVINQLDRVALNATKEDK